MKAMGALMMVIESLQSIPFTLEDILSGMVSYGRVQDYLRKNAETEELAMITMPNRKTEDPERKAVEISNLSFHYNLISDPSPFSIDIESLEIKKGEKICIVGNNGSGKSTLLALMSGQLDGYLSQEGKDYKYGINGSIGVVQQNIWLTNDSIKVPLPY